MKTQELINRAAVLLARLKEPREDSVERVYEVYAGTLTLLSAVYGSGSPHESTLREVEQQVRDWSEKYRGDFRSHVPKLEKAVQGTLQNLKGELEAGIAGSIARRVSGELLGDLVELAKEAASDGGEPAKNVAAVLSAAAYEDTMRRMGSSLAGVTGRPKLSLVVEDLGKAGVLAGAQLNIARSYLQFRNDALHADWAKVELASVQSVLGFVEQMLLKHFGA